MRKVHDNKSYFLVERIAGTTILKQGKKSCCTYPSPCFPALVDLLFFLSEVYHKLICAAPCCTPMMRKGTEQYSQVIIIDLQ